MKTEFNDICAKTVWALMRQAGWDPQSHDREGIIGIRSYVSSLIDILETGDMARALRHLRESSGRMATYLNEQGYYRSVYNKEPLSGEDVDEVLRVNLGDYFQLPPAIRAL